ncbi:hypothetical protein JTE90_002924 [Oedothorax gibbosus]|uniref:FANCI solenoid 1 domain-containing protein n=1 Tax=Oedothorax gibbosus TaxID=931172 RepID=A0AAV6UUV9_9ARAC|nr:hypothetical protein JTE90_002924 [Oedothorax gibbosus]
MSTPSAIKDIDLSDDELKLVSESVLKTLPDVKLIELPSFVYQLLLLSSIGQGVVAHFTKQDQRFQGEEIAGLQRHCPYLVEILSRDAQEGHILH